MSNDLISRSALMSKLLINSKGQAIPEVDCDNFPITLTIRDVKNLIRNEPKAYDVDEKIKQLQKLAGNGHHDTLFDHKWNLFLRANKVYNIVKGGGTSER